MFIFAELKQYDKFSFNERQYFKKFKFQFFLTFPPFLLTQISARFCIDPTAFLTEKQDCYKDCRFLQLLLFIIPEGLPESFCKQEL